MVSPPPPGSAIHRETLLVVDDVALVRRALVRALLAEGYHVIEATSGQEALEHFHDGVALVITDVRMPRMSGSSFAQRLRERRVDVPILFLSGHADDDVPAAPRTAFLSKPFATPDLVHTIRRLLDEAPPR